MPRIYCPFPDNAARDGWPSEYVALDEYNAMLNKRDQALNERDELSRKLVAAERALRTIEQYGHPTKFDPSAVARAALYNVDGLNRL